MSNVVVLRPKQDTLPSNVYMVSEVEIAHEVTRYCLEVMLNNKQISQREFDCATDFVDSAYLFDYDMHKQ
jgi:hypothetical protein